MPETIGNWWMWTAFAVFVVVACAIDLFVLEKKGNTKVTVREALGWSAIWVALAGFFGAGLWLVLRETAGEAIATQKTGEFFTGYLIEKSLAVDNIFVFLMLFTYFAIPAAMQRRVLVLGILGAIVLRVVMILVGAWLVAKFHWVLYLFGLFLLVTGVKMLLVAGKEPDLEANPVLRWMRARLPITNEHHGERFAILRDGKRWYTPLFVVLVLIGVTDIVFAVDSIPAIFAITTDPFIVMTSNVFAILGLRAMYFVLADMKDRFSLLGYGLGVVLVFVGVKMLLIDLYKIPVMVSLAVVASIIAASIVASLVVTRRAAPRPLPSQS